MNSSYVNMGVGALLATLFVLKSVSLVSGAIFSQEAPEKPGFTIAAEEAPGAGGKAAAASMPTSVTLFDQGLLQVLQASATGLEPKSPYVLALSERPDGSGALQPLARFMTNPAGSAIVNASGPIRQVAQSATDDARRYLVIAPQVAGQAGKPVQVQEL